ncbi:unnamed protein product, partial [Laminaria digitata]
DGGFDARGPGAAGGGARLPKTAEVSMATFRKEEDYWDRLERLEAEAEGKPIKKSSAPSSSLSGRKRPAAPTSHGEKSRKIHPKMRSVQQPMLPARARPKDTTSHGENSRKMPPKMQPKIRSVQEPMLPARPRSTFFAQARPLAGSLAGSPRKSGISSSSRRGVRDSVPARPAEIGGAESGAVSPQPQPWTPDQDGAAATGGARRRAASKQPHRWTPSQLPPDRPLPPPSPPSPPRRPPQPTAAAKPSRKNGRPLVTDLLANMLN